MTQTARAKGSEQQLGFSILEMLVVLAILAVAFALVAPSLDRARSALAVRTAAYELAAQLRSARATAHAQSVQRMLVFDEPGNTYWSEGMASPRQVAPGSVSTSLMVPQGERVGRMARIRFLPDGSASGGQITLRDKRSTWTVTVDWLSGDVRVVPGS